MDNFSYENYRLLMVNYLSIHKPLQQFFSFRSRKRIRYQRSNHIIYSVNDVTWFISPSPHNWFFFLIVFNVKIYLFSYFVFFFFLCKMCTLDIRHDYRVYIFIYHNWRTDKNIYAHLYIYLFISVVENRRARVEELILASQLYHLFCLSIYIRITFFFLTTNKNLFTI